MNVYRIDQITFAPFDIIAEDRDQAANTFLIALVCGLQNRPDVTFDVSQWTMQRLKRFDTHRRLAEEASRGIVWPTADGLAWELIPYFFERK